MGIDLYWDNDEQNIILAEFPTKWTWTELFSMLDDVKKVSDQRDYPIGMVLDVRSGTTIPSGSIFNPDTLAKAKRLIQMNKEQSDKGPVVILGANNFIKTIYHTFGTLDKNITQDVFFAQTESQAHDILHQQLQQRLHVN